MIVSTRFAGDIDNCREFQIIYCIRRITIAVPSGRAVVADLSTRHILFQQFESGSKAQIELLARYLAELHLRVMQIVDVYCLYIKILTTAVYLFLKISRGKAVAARHNFALRDDTGLDEVLLKIFGRIRRRSAVKRNK